MAVKTSAYWQKRFSDIENMNNRTAQNTFYAIEPSFDKAQAQIQSQIDRWYSRFASNNEITLQEARKWLTDSELKELKWDIDDYIKAGQENALDGRWMKELENASAKFHISRLEALKLRTQQSLEMAFGNERDSIDAMMRDVYQSGYYHSCFEVQKGFNIGWEIGQIDDKRLERIISKPWASDGKNFSDRVWEHKTQMVGELHQQMTRTLIQGKSPDESIKSLEKYLSDRTKNAKYKAGRLVMTESAAMSSEAQKNAFNDLDVEEFEIVATLDSKTSDICRREDGKHYPMKDYEVGVTAPPFHVYCRSCTCPYFDDNYGERAARNADGDTYYVPSDMTYKEWAKKSIKSSSIDNIRDPIDIKLDAEVSGLSQLTNVGKIEVIGNEFNHDVYEVTIDKRNSIKWDDMSTDGQAHFRYTRQQYKPYNIDKGKYRVSRYVEGSYEASIRDDIAEGIGAKYIGTNWNLKNGIMTSIDFYQKDDKIMVAIKNADIKKRMSKDSFDSVKNAIIEREKQIIGNIGETNAGYLIQRKGDEWSMAMKEFHHTIGADGKPNIISDDEYDALISPTLYRGIAPQSNLRKDITSTLSTKEMADEFFKGDVPFPSRGIYGDGIAYASPAKRKIAENYATQNNTVKGGVVIEFKLKADARIIEYDDALNIFQQMSHKINSQVLVNPRQVNARNSEVGKAMNALGYDAIIKHNGDNTGEDFYVILNRGALVAKKKYITKFT